MKIEKQNPWHWLYLLIFTFNVLIGVVARWLLGMRVNSIVLYGHKLHGNLSAICEHLNSDRAMGLEAAFLTMDSEYLNQLRAEGNRRCLNALNLFDVIIACRAQVIVTDHGPHSLLLLNRLTDTAFVDVWHGIPFKGFDARDFRLLHGYRGTFVASPSMKRMYENRFGFDPARVFVTGYGRTDRLVKRDYDRSEIFARLNIEDKYRSTILFAPTWSHGQKGRVNIPFAMRVEEFFHAIDRLAGERNWLVVFRAHLNSPGQRMQSVSNIEFVPLSVHPHTEELLFIADALVSDWSSIVFDYLVLRRPTIFLDTEPPFRKGFSYGPEYRFGPAVGTFDELCASMIEAVDTPEAIIDRHREAMDGAAAEVYGRFADGCATERYIERIEQFVRTGYFA